MYVHFDKYHGTGNDFVIINNRNGDVQLTEEQIAFICNRRFGVGADGLMLLNNHPTLDFEMLYYNSDGKQSTMCGNGGRCLAHFAYRQGIQKELLVFDAVDGLHNAVILPNNWVKLQMVDVNGVQKLGQQTFELNTGSPHYVHYIQDLENCEVVKNGQAVRYSDHYKNNGGINVNFVEFKDDQLHIRTYERGVEDETFSCGTGATAAAITTAEADGKYEVPILTKGGELSVQFNKQNQSFTDVWLSGPATFVFAGVIEL